MTKLIAFLLLLSTSAFAQSPKIWLVTSADPHDLAELRPFVRSEKIRGRALTVELNTKKIPARIRKLLRQVPLSDFKTYHYQPKGKVAVNPRILDLVSEVRTANLQRTVDKFSSVEDRSAGAAGNRVIMDWSKREFEQLGYASSFHCYEQNICNVIAEKRGTREPEKVILVIAHLDSVGAAFAGADDNASGAAGALEMARILAPLGSAKTIRFVLANSEEDGLIGSSAYVRSLGASGMAQLELVIAMDMIGYNSNGIMDLETDKEHEAMVQWYAERVRAYTKLRSRIAMPAWGSDHVPFLRANIPTLLTIEYWDTKTPCYHQRCDKPDTVNYEYAAEITRVNLAVVAEKAL